MGKYLEMIGLPDVIDRRGTNRTWIKDKMDITYQTLANWERGNSEPGVSQMEKLCKLLECEKEELYHDK